MGSEKKKKIPLFSWALYDLANQFFALNIVSLYFPRWLTMEKGAPEFFYSLAFGFSMFFVAVCAPVLGVISDIRNRRRIFLVFFTILSVVFTVYLGRTANLFFALLFFAIANFGCQTAIIFYNALMVEVAPRRRIGTVSGLGRMFGYSGAILALYLTKPVILKAGYHATFLFTGILFLIFSLPCMIFIKEKTAAEKLDLLYFVKKERLFQIFGKLRATVFDSYQSGSLKSFLKAAFFGLCVVNTTILFMAVYAGKAFYLGESKIIDLVAFSTVFAMAGSILSGVISDIVGHKRSLLGVFVLWIVCIILGAVLRAPYHWLVGALVGFSLGSTWVILRALVIKLVPEEKIAEAFGLFNLVVYISGVVGPLCWGLILLYASGFGEIGYRLSFLSLIIFMGIGTFFISKIDGKQAGEVPK